MTPTELDQLWGTCLLSGPSVPSTVRRRVGSDTGRNVFVGVQYPSGERCVIVELDELSVLDLPEVDTLGFVIRADVSGGITTVRVSLANIALSSVFLAFATDVVAAITVAASDANAAEALSVELRKWITLFTRTRVGLDDEARLGLFGELQVLAGQVAPLVGIGSAIASWRGPHRGLHDFEFRAGGLEVKTTRVGTASVTITSVDQLDPADGATLHLAVVVVEEDPTSAHGETLNDIVDRVRNEVGAGGRIVLEDALVRAGYHDIHRDRYGSAIYAVASARLFTVNKDFPSLRRAFLPAAVSVDRYRIAQNAMDTFERDWVSLKEIV